LGGNGFFRPKLKLQRQKAGARSRLEQPSYNAIDSESNETVFLHNNLCLDGMASDIATRMGTLGQ
jgi:hypothetical protein